MSEKILDFEIDPDEECVYMGYLSSSESNNRVRRVLPGVKYQGPSSAALGFGLLTQQPRVRIPAAPFHFTA